MAWVIDDSHSYVGFSARHMMISTVRGQFHKVHGTVDFNENEPTLSTVNVEIETASVDTRDEKRDGHLKSPDFFDVETYPVMTFKSKRVEQTGDNTGKLTGDLTIANVTREVILNVEYNGVSTSPWGSQSAGFSGTTKISRKEWGLEWNVALETGGVLVGDEIKIDIELEIIKQQDEQLAEATA